jgi:hypothetical protein
MRELWKAYGLIVTDQNLRQTTSGTAAVIDRSDLKGIINPNLPEAKNLAGDLEPQPDVVALHLIDMAFRGRGIHMSVYEQAEINRWFLEDKVTAAGPAGKFSAALEHMRTLLEAASFDLQSIPFLQCVGVLIADKRFRVAFTGGSESLTAHNFDPAGKEAELRTFFTPNGAGDQVADQIFKLGWPAPPCIAPLLNYPAYIHPNR